MSLRTTDYGWEDTQVMPVTVSQPTMVTSSPQWITTMTRPPSAAPVLLLMVVDGGFTGELGKYVSNISVCHL